MPDLEKTIQGLELCAGNSTCKWKKCPYNPKHIDHPNYPACRIELENDAIALLKAKQPKKVRCVRRLTRVMKGVCPACELEIESVCAGIRITKFCKFCGQAVKWDE